MKQSMHTIISAKNDFCTPYQYEPLPMNNLKEHIALRKSLSEVRFRPYLREAQKYFSRPEDSSEAAISLYVWSAELAGLFHTQISYVEVATRNAISRELSNWSEAQQHSKYWTRRNRQQDLNQLLGQEDIGRAIGLIKREKVNSYHPRHDDIVAKLSFSFWVNIVKDQNQPSDAFRKTLWENGLNLAFPYAQEKNEHGVLDLEKTRLLTANQLSSVLTLRNRIAHHDNILKVQHELLLHRIYALLGRIGGDDLTDSIDPRPVRAHISADPRKQWNKS